MLVFPGEGSAPPSRETIHAFINGYEHGRDRRGMIGTMIAGALSSSFEVVDQDAYRFWDRHIEDIAKARQKPWFEVFAEIGGIIFEDAGIDPDSMNPQAG